MINGIWKNENINVVNGAYIRPQSRIKNANTNEWIDVMQNCPGRVWLIASHSCPWSHRASITRQLKKLADHIPIHYAFGPRDQGYSLNGESEWEIPGTSLSSRYLHALYKIHDDRYNGQVSVPLLWDSLTQSIVSNESSDIIAGFDAVNIFEGIEYSLRPHYLNHRINLANDGIYTGLNNAVYRAGFAQSQDVYDESVKAVFKTLDELNDRLVSRRYYFGSVITEVDVRIFTTLIRFDSIYYILFKCSTRRLVDYPALFAYARDFYGIKGVAETVNFDLMRTASYLADSDASYPIVAAQPDIDWAADHHRLHLGATQIYSKKGYLVEVDLTTVGTQFP